MLCLLRCQQEMRDYDWHPKLLEHELCDEISVMVMAPQAAGTVAGNHTGTVPGAGAFHAFARPSSTAIQGSSNPQASLLQLPYNASELNLSRLGTMSGLGEAWRPASIGMHTRGPPQLPTAAPSALPSAAGNWGSHRSPSELRAAYAGPGLLPSSFNRPSFSRFSYGLIPVPAAGSVVPTVSGGGTPSTNPSPDFTVTKKVLMRGLRLKASLDVGPLRDTLRPSSGAIEYRGRVLNRAARIGEGGS